MKILNLREVKAKLSQIVSSLSSEGSVIITRNGQPCAVLMPVTEETDLEVVAISQNRQFWELLDKASARSEKEGWTALEELS